MSQVMILDDDPLLIKTLKRSLEGRESGSHFKVTIEANVEKALELAKDAVNFGEPYDVCLINHRPGFEPSGIEIMDMLFSVSPGTDVIIMAAADNPEDRMRAYKSGAYQYLPKPIEGEELIILLNSLERWRTTQQERDLLINLNELIERILGEISYSSNQQLAQEIAESALSFGFERAFIYSYTYLNPTQLVGEYQAGKNILPGFSGHHFSLGSSHHVTKILESREVLIVASADPGKCLLTQVYGNEFAKPIGEWAILPLCIGDELLGVMVLDNISVPRRFRDEELNALRLFARLIAASLERLRLNERERENTRSEDLLRRASVALLEIANEDEEIMWLMLLKLATSDYGLGFNRAWIFLSEDDGAKLKGILGVGYLIETNARASWENGETEKIDFDYLLDSIRKESVQHTPLEEITRGFQIDLDTEETSFNRVLMTGIREYIPIENTREMPQAFRNAFEPADCAVIPLHAGKKISGLVIVDNKFDRKTIREEILDRLQVFTNIACLVWQNLGQRKQREAMLDAASVIMREVGDQPLRSTLSRICEAAITVSGAKNAVIYPMKPGKETYVYDIDNLAFAGDVDLAHVKERSRPKSLSAHILRSGILVVNDVSEQRKISGYSSLYDHPFIQREDIGAMIGAPISANAVSVQNNNDSFDSGLGVLYLNFRNPRRFSAQDRRQAQTFANLAAIAILNAHRAIHEEINLEPAISRQETNQRELEILHNVFQNALVDLSEDEMIRTLLWNLLDILGSSVLDPALILRRWHSSDITGESRLSFTRFRLDVDGVVVEESIDMSQAEPINQLLQSGMGGVIADSGEFVEPINLAEENIGALVVRVMPLKKAQDYRAVLGRFARVAALTLDNVRRQEHLSSVLRAAQAVTEPIDLQQTFDWVVETVRQVTPDLSALTLWYRHPESRKVLCGTHFGVWNAKDMSKEEPPPGSLVWSVMDAPNPIIVSRVYEGHMLYRNFVPQEKIVSVAAFPLKAHDVRVGAIFLNYRHERRFSQDVRTIFTILAEIVATSIRGVLLIEDRRKESARLETTLQTVEAVGTSLELDDILYSVLRQLCEALDDTMICIMTYDEDDKQLVFTRASREFYKIENPAFKDLMVVNLATPAIACRVAQSSIENGFMVDEYIPDIALDNDYLALIYSTQSELCVGLYGDDRLLGVLVLERSWKDGFSEEDRKLVRGIAQQISQAIARSRQSEKLKFQQVVATATAWAADLAHDMNSELGLIRNSAYMIQELVDEPKVLGYAQDIEETAERLAGTNPWLPEPRPILIDEFIERKVLEYAPKLAEPVDLFFDLNCPEVEVWGNPYFVERVVRHLVRNASRAMRGVSPRRLKIRTNLTEDERIEIQFEDSGPGVPPELRSRILQESVSTKGDQQGGFGLLLARQTVEDMGGTIRLLPGAIGKGATFSIRLPIRPEQVSINLVDVARGEIKDD